jgi:hypothetical protein
VKSENPSLPSPPALLWNNRSFAFPEVDFLIIRHHQLGTTFFRTPPNKEDGRNRE